MFRTIFAQLLSLFSNSARRKNLKTFLLYLPSPGLETVAISHALELIKSGVVISEPLLEHGRHLGKPPPHFSVGVGDWEGSSGEDEMDDLLLKAAELVILIQLLEVVTMIFTTSYLKPDVSLILSCFILEKGQR